MIDYAVYKIPFSGHRRYAKVHTRSLPELEEHVANNHLCIARLVSRQLERV